MSRSNYQRDRQRFASKFEVDLKRKAKALQAELYREIYRYLSSSVTTDQNGFVRFNIRNVRAANGVGSAIKAFAANQGRKLLTWIIRRLSDLFGVNKNYFRSFLEYPGSRDESALRLIMMRLGYDTNNGRIIPGGYLSGVFQLDQVATQVGRDIQQALATKPTLNQFRSAFRARFFSAGYVERHFQRFTGDLFHQFDRAAQTVLADELNLEHFAYSGTLIKTSRCFCERRVNRIYTKAFAANWNDIKWRGKIENGDFFQDAGGYNCRHHLSYISKQQAERMANQRGFEINTFTETGCNERIE